MKYLKTDELFRYAIVHYNDDNHNATSPVDRCSVAAQINGFVRPLWFISGPFCTYILDARFCVIYIWGATSRFWIFPLLLSTIFLYPSLCTNPLIIKPFRPVFVFIFLICILNVSYIYIHFVQLEIFFHLTWVINSALYQNSGGWVVKEVVSKTERPWFKSCRVVSMSAKKIHTIC